MKIRTLIFSSIGLLLLSACAPASSAPTPDVALIQTSAAQTVMANFTLTAAVSTPTPLPPPSDTPVPANTSTLIPGVPSETPTLLPGGVTATPILCDHLIFDPATIDVNIPDNTQMALGQQFVKTWRVKNDGSCTWGAGYSVIFSYGDQMSGKAQAFNGAVAPGQEVELSVNFTAPTKAGTYLSAWQLANANGKAFPKVIFVKVVVK